MSKRSESLSSEAVGLAYLMFGLIVRRNPFLAEPFVPHRAFAGVSASSLAKSYNHGDMLLQMVTESDQVTAPGSVHAWAGEPGLRSFVLFPTVQMSNGRKRDAWKLARCLSSSRLLLLLQRSVRRKTLVGLVSQQIEDEDCKSWISDAMVIIVAAQRRPWPFVDSLSAA